jgi:MFS family permease
MIAPAASMTDRTLRAREDRRRIYLAKAARSIAYGALSGFLFLYLEMDLAFSPFSSLIITAFTLVGTAFWNLAVLPPLDRRFGRRWTLGIFGGLFTFSAVLLFLANSAWEVIIAVLLGGVAASTADNGPLASLDQAILPSTLRRSRRAAGFATYNLLANFASAGGALLLSVPGSLSPQSIPLLPGAPHPWLLLIYVILALTTWFAYTGLSEAVEVEPDPSPHSTSTVSDTTQGYLRALAVLFGLDAFAGGLVYNPFIAAYFHIVWNQPDAVIGLVLFIIGTVAGLSLLVASWLAQRFGLLNTMVFTHIPSNVLLILVPLMPSFALAFGVLIARFALSQMDVPTRQTYTMELVSNRERLPVAATLSGTRAVSQAGGPFPTAGFTAAGLVAVPFELAGVLKLIYDILLYRRFRNVPVERGRPYRELPLGDVSPTSWSPRDG